MDIKIVNSTIVVADDSRTILKKMKMLLENQGYQVYTAQDGKKALDLVEKINPDLVILDLDMPCMNGLEVCKILKDSEITNLTPVIIITSSGSREDKNLAISYGANDFLDKNFDTLELKLKVESLLKLKHAINQLENARNIIKSLAKAVEVKDKYTEGHAERVSFYAVEMARSIGLEEPQIKDMKMAGLLHDIGKIGVPDVVLNKPGKLTNEEFDIIKSHPVIGEEICAPIKSFGNVKNIIRSHHEKLNGTGYPDGLKGDEISIEVRIMAVADIFDALTSTRSYRQAMDREMAIDILEEDAIKGGVDGSVVKVLNRISRKWVK